MNVLVVAPHPDDETIGCGGALARHVDAGDRVRVAFLTSGELSDKERPPEEVKAEREREAQAAAGVLGGCELEFLRLPDWGIEHELPRGCVELRRIVERMAPDRVYVPHGDEWHPDHRAAFVITTRVTRHLATDVLAYEVWTPLREYSVVEDITQQMARKLEALRRYRSQLRDFDYVRAADGLNRYRGALAARSDYAEVFARPASGAARVG